MTKRHPTDIEGVPASLSPELLDQLADLVVAKLTAEKMGNLPSKQVVAGSSPVSRSSYLASDSSQKFTNETLQSFVESRASGTSPKTIAVYHLALDNFVGYTLTPEGINTYLNSLKCGNAKHNYYRCIKTLCRWLYYTGQLPSNPIEKVLPPRRQKKLLPAVSKEQLDILLNHCLSQRDKVTLSLLWYSGMRLSEAVSVEAIDFNWQEGTVIILGKGNRYRKALAGNGIVKEWYSKHETLGITTRGVQTMLHKLGAATGIKCNAHSFRRGFCVHNIKLGLSNKIIQSLGGWETPDMVSHYAQSLTFEEFSPPAPHPVR